jgi:alkanesulfonate monooxygenase SsuD/methylene tetrahydromethanopterin reductase-like flavin-dependent oxidoreductase (luciferase family)
VGAGERGTAFRLGVLELGPPHHAVRLAPELERLGYFRYWMSEHYSPTQSPAPLVLGAAVAAALPPGATMRVGTAGVLLHYRSPASVVRDASVLAALAPGRVDLGVAAAATGAPALDESLLDGRGRPDGAAFEAKVRAIVELFARRREDPAMPIGPFGSPDPELWVCGTSARSAAVAARCGVAYAFHLGLAPSGADGPAIVRGYREQFCARGGLGAPRVAVAMWCPPTNDPEAARRTLGLVARAYATDDLVVAALDPDVERQLREYRATARIAGLGADRPSAV